MPVFPMDFFSDFNSAFFARCSSRPSSCSNYDAIIIEGSLRDITLSIIFQNRSIP